MNIENWIVGYVDRFEGIMTRPVAEWIEDSTDEEWIPEHRIRFFARWDDVGGEKYMIMWDRRTRVDRIWGSGDGG